MTTIALFFQIILQKDSTTSVFVVVHSAIVWHWIVKIFQSHQNFKNMVAVKIIIKDKDKYLYFSKFFLKIAVKYLCH